MRSPEGVLILGAVMPGDFTRCHYCHKDLSSAELFCATKSLTEMGQLIGVAEDELPTWVVKHMPLCQECINTRRIWRPAKRE